VQRASAVHVQVVPGGRKDEPSLETESDLAGPRVVAAGGLPHHAVIVDQLAVRSPVAVIGFLRRFRWLVRRLLGFVRRIVGRLELVIRRAGIAIPRVAGRLERR
jgi:hypothetical protein